MKKKITPVVLVVVLIFLVICVGILSILRSILHPERR